MKCLLQGFLAAAGLIVVGAAAYVWLGFAPVATTSAPLPFEQLVTGVAQRARVKREAPKSSPIPPTEDVYVAAARIYRSHCAVCHGLPRHEQTAIAKGEFPKPPELFKAEGVTDEPVGDTYWIVSNGIRLTGMPGFMGSLSSDQIWQVSLLLANADKLPPAVKRALQAPLTQ
jgi:thiosulfate dehydrogenase